MSQFRELQLNWFKTNVGKVQEFPLPLENGALLATKAKGIYKPAGSIYAVSIRVQIKSRYRDGAIIDFPEGGWGFAYHQEENPGEKHKDENLFTNVSLIRCWEDEQDFGVMKQVEQRKSSTSSKYLILGLARVVNKVGDFFIIADHNSAKKYSDSELVSMILMGQAQCSVIEEEPVEEIDEYDDRVRTFRSIVLRQGQGKFRRELMEQYENRCAITNCEVSEILDAAHVRPYRGAQTNSLNNGLILRTDVHTLFDLDLLGIDPANLQVVVAESISDPFYSSVTGLVVRSPLSPQFQLFKGALEYRWGLFNLKRFKN